MRFDDLAPGPAPQLPLATYQQRRQRLAKELGPGQTAVVATHLTHQYSHDVEYLYRPHSDFWYLTGLNEPGCVLIVEGGSGRTTLFLRDRKKEAEIWTGRRLGPVRAPATLLVDAAYPIEELPARLAAVLGKSKVHLVADHDPAVRRRVAAVAGPRLVKDPGSDRPGGPAKKPVKKGGLRHAREMIHDMRLVKEPLELRMMAKACDLGVEGHLAALPRIRAGAKEYQVEADFSHHARLNGSTGCGYPSICGCGENAAVLHYITNLAPLKQGEMFLIDAGCEWGYYTSDITRTYPVGGRFSPMQQKLYTLVYDAQRAGMKAVRPGAPFTAPHEAAVDTIVAGLLDLGMVKGSFESVKKDQSYRSFFMHGTSHWLGIDVHDAGGRTGPDGKPRRLQEGMVLTVEPGLYFNKDFAACPPGSKGIGIRIEDDLVVTGAGNRNLTKALPSAPEAVAELAAQAARRRS